MQKITPHLWFDSEAEEAAQFYISIFNDSKIGKTVRYGKAGFEIHGQPEGKVMTVDFEIEGYKVIALNGGPIFKITPAISFMVSCPKPEEVDELWAKLSEGGTPLMPLDKYFFSEKYGWIQDKFGMSWQLICNDKATKREIIPSFLFSGPVAGKAEEAFTFYTSVFANSKIGEVAKYPTTDEFNKEGTVMYADFILEGQKFAAMDSAYAHGFNFTEAVSLLVTCSDQDELDNLWSKLSAVPESEQCGWLKDKFGVSWQIVPSGMEDALNNPDREKADRAMNAMLQMKKIDIAKIREAAEGK